MLYLYAKLIFSKNTGFETNFDIKPTFCFIKNSNHFRKMSDNNVFLCRFVLCAKTLNSIDHTHLTTIFLCSCVYLCIYFICHIWTKNFDYCLQLTRTFVSICLELI